MSTPAFHSDDPRLTAYALDEMPLAERAEFEQLLASSSEARAALDEVQETIGLLRSGLATEPVPSLTTVQRDAVQELLTANLNAAGLNAAQVQVMHVASDATAARQPSRLAVWSGLGATAAAMVAVAMTLPGDSSSRPAAAPAFTSLETSTDFDLSLQSGQYAALSDSDSDQLRSVSLDGLADRPVMDESLVRRKGSEQQVSEQQLTRASSSSELNRTAMGSRLMGESGHPFSGPQRSLPAAGKPVQGSGGAKGNTALTLTADSSRAEGMVTAPADGKPSRQIADTRNYGLADGEKSRSLGLERGRENAGSPAKAPAPGAAPASDSLRMRFATPAEPAPVTADRFISATAAPGTPAPAPDSVALTEGAPSRQVRVLSSEKEQVTESLRQVARLGREGRGLAPEDEVDRLSGLEKRYWYYREARRPDAGAEAYDPIIENEFTSPVDQPLSTFSIDVDTASYANVRRFLQQGQLPPRNAVRVEELVNYFRYDYPEPKDNQPFSVTIDVAVCPWQPRHKLARVGLKAKSFQEQKRPPTNLVFLLDVSGSMRPANKLPLVQQAMSVLVSEMTEDDQIAIVTYAGDAGLKLNSTTGAKRSEIQGVIDNLSAGGSTNGAAGIELAYDTAIKHFIKGGANRVILCTDGDFNVGVSDDNRLVEIIQEKAASGVFLSVFGFGMGNLKDGKLEKLADKGNGQYGYIDGLREARKVFNEQLAGTLFTVAKDVKLQLDFDRMNVGAYRLIGYENRVLAAQDFDDDTKDAGEIGAGHTVTALYEIMPKPVWLERMGIDGTKSDLVSKTGTEPAATSKPEAPPTKRLFTVKLRHKDPESETSERSLDYPVNDVDALLAKANPDFQFAAAVASFGMNLRDSRFRGQWTLADVLTVAETAKGPDSNGDRAEFLDLVRTAIRIQGQTVPADDPPVVRPADVKELPPNEARIKASVNGKYRRLLKKIEVRGDYGSYGEFRDWGHYEGTSYAGHSDLPAGYWVWVYPNWYIWGDLVKADEAGATPPAAGQPAPAATPAPASPK